MAAEKDEGIATFTNQDRRNLGGTVNDIPWISHYSSVYIPWRRPPCRCVCTKQNAEPYCMSCSSCEDADLNVSDTGVQFLVRQCGCGENLVSLSLSGCHTLCWAVHTPWKALALYSLRFAFSVGFLPDSRVLCLAHLNGMAQVLRDVRIEAWKKLQKQEVAEIWSLCTCAVSSCRVVYNSLHLLHHETTADICNGVWVSIAFLVTKASDL